jgi:hypothetical protein
LDQFDAAVLELAARAAGALAIGQEVEPQDKTRRERY